MKTNLCRLQILKTLENGNLEVFFEDLSRNKNAILTLASEHQVFSLLEQFGIVILEYENDTYPALPEYNWYLQAQRKEQFKLQRDLLFSFLLLLVFMALCSYIVLKHF